MIIALIFVILSVYIPYVWGINCQSGVPAWLNFANGYAVECHSFSYYTGCVLNHCDFTVNVAGDQWPNGLCYEKLKQMFDAYGCNNYQVIHHWNDYCSQPCGGANRCSCCGGYCSNSDHLHIERRSLWPSGACKYCIDKIQDCNNVCWGPDNWVAIEYDARF